jgi:hypothetical protein
MVGLASANTIWNPKDPNAAVNGYSNWNWTNGTQTNWNNGIPTLGSGVNDGKAVFNVGSAAECRIDSLVGCKWLVMGDGGSATPVVRIVDGGTLYTQTSDWDAVGYSQSATMIIEAGGSLETAGRFGVGWFTAATGESKLLVNGGHVVIGAARSGALQIGAPGTSVHKGYVSVTEGGLIEVSGGLEFNTADASEINLEFGSIVFSTNVKTQLDTLIASNKIKGFGGLTTPTAVYASGKTTLTAPDPMNRNPVYTMVLPGSRNLTWTNLAPVAPATDVWVDVWFGTDPNKLGANYTKVLTKGKNATSVTVNAPLVTEPTTYYWQVDSYCEGEAGPVAEGVVTPFYVTANTPPSVVINTPRTATWINEPIQLDSTLTDDGTSVVTYQWTSDDPNAVFTPSATVADPAVSVNWHTGPFTVKVTVDDGFNPPVSSGSIAMDCAVDACQAATAVINLDALHPGDIVVDCKGNLTDFAAIAGQWLTDYALTDPIAVP